MHHLIEGVEPDVRAEYWDGNRDTLELMEAFLAWGADFLPAPIRRALTR